MNESNTVQRGVSMPIVIGIIVFALLVIAAFIFFPQSSPSERVDEKEVKVVVFKFEWKLKFKK